MSFALPNGRPSQRMTPLNISTCHQLSALDATMRSGPAYCREQHRNIDVVVVSLLVTNNQPHVIVGKMAVVVDFWKYSKHLRPCEQARYGFQAFAVDLLGSWQKIAGIAASYLVSPCSLWGISYMQGQWPGSASHALTERLTVSWACPMCLGSIWNNKE